MDLLLYCTVCREPLSEDRIRRGASVCGPERDCKKMVRKVQRKLRLLKVCPACGFRPRQRDTLNARDIDAFIAAQKFPGLAAYIVPKLESHYRFTRAQAVTQWERHMERITKSQPVACELGSQPSVGVV